MRGECGARKELRPGEWAACTRLATAYDHQGKDHRAADGTIWPACSQHCLLDHVHGGYRLHLVSEPVIYAERQTFEELLSAPLEQFDPRSELLAALLKSIKEYAAAPSNTPSMPIHASSAAPGHRECAAGTAPG